MKEILQFIETSFDDNYISKSERKALKEIITENNPSKRELDWLRSEIFKLAKSRISTSKDMDILDWLESANKLILPRLTEHKNNEVYFSPGNDCLQAINNLISFATNSIDVCVFTISDNRIADKLLYAKEKGIQIRIITDNDKSFDRGSDIQALSGNGIPVKIDNTEHHMHHKFAVFDKKTVVTGSFNWTRSASEYNQENIIVLHDNKSALEYTRQFDKLWDKLYNY